MFTYLTGVALTLLLAGRISDAFGRTPVTSLTLMLAIVGCIMFMMADSGAAVLAARFVQGLSAGFGMSAVSALVIDCVGEKHLGWGSTVASCGAMVGIMIGSVAVGVLYDIVPSIAVLYGIMIVILAVITMNAILGTVQTVKASASLDSLKQMSAPTAKVLRDGQIVQIPGREVVPGDVVILLSLIHI